MFYVAWASPTLLFNGQIWFSDLPAGSLSSLTVHRLETLHAHKVYDKSYNAHHTSSFLCCRRNPLADLLSIRSARIFYNQVLQCKSYNAHHTFFMSMISSYFSKYLIQIAESCCAFLSNIQNYLANNTIRKNQVFFGKHVRPPFALWLTIYWTLPRFHSIHISGCPFIPRNIPSGILLTTCWQNNGQIYPLEGSSLLMAGMIFLVESVILSSLVYSMMIYWWPRSILKEIEQSMHNFIWSGDIHKRGSFTIAWARYCALKSNDGLGIRSIKTANKFFLCHLRWDILSSTSPSIHFWRDRFLGANRLPRRANFRSSMWCSIKNHVTSSYADSRWLIGDHSQVHFWLDNWLG